MLLPSPMSSLSFSFTTLATLVVSFALTLWQSTSNDPLSLLSTSMANAPAELVVWASDLLKATQLSKSVVFLALLYLSKLNQIVPMTYFSPRSSITVSLVLASKFLEDATYSNQAWANLSGMDSKMLVHLEMQMLDMLNYNLTVSTLEYSQWIDQMQSAIGGPTSVPSSPTLTSTTTIPTHVSSTLKCSLPPPSSSSSSSISSSSSLLPSRSSSSLLTWAGNAMMQHKTSSFLSSTTNTIKQSHAPLPLPLHFHSSYPSPHHHQQQHQYYPHLHHPENHHGKTGDTHLHSHPLTSSSSAPFFSESSSSLKSVPPMFPSLPPHPPSSSLPLPLMFPVALPMQLVPVLPYYHFLPFPTSSFSWVVPPYT